MPGHKQVYILLTGTDTWLGRMIQWYTKAPLNHASIAFDENLGELFSFGRKYENNPLVGGLVRENIDTPLAESPLFCRKFTEGGPSRILDQKAGIPVECSYACPYCSLCRRLRTVRSKNRRNP